MKKQSLLLGLCVLLIPSILMGEEFVLKDGTKINGKMIGIRGDSIDVETLYGKIKLTKNNIVSISFPENQPKAAAENKEAEPTRIKVEQSLDGTSYVNRTGQFKLTVPAGWKIAPDAVRASEGAIAFLMSPDGNLGLAVFRETFEGSIKAYQGMLENVRKRVPGYRKVSEGQTALSGAASATVVWEGKPQDIVVTFMDRIVPVEGGMTVVRGFAPEPLFDEKKETLETIVLSYEILK